MTSETDDGMQADDEGLDHGDYMEPGGEPPRPDPEHERKLVVEKEPPKSPWWSVVVPHQVERATRAIILNDNGTLGVRKIKEMLVKDKTGTYVHEERKRYYNHRWIPPGWIDVFFENDPRPVIKGNPGVYNARLVDVVTGDKIIHLVGGGYKKGVQFNARMLLIAAILLVSAIGSVLYFGYTRLGWFA